MPRRAEKFVALGPVVAQYSNTFKLFLSYRLFPHRSGQKWRSRWKATGSPARHMICTRYQAPISVPINSAMIASTTSEARWGTFCTGSSINRISPRSMKSSFSLTISRVSRVLISLSQFRRPTRVRSIQPVELIAVELGRRRAVNVIVDALSNGGNEELKTITDPVARHQLLEEAIKLNAPLEMYKGKKILLLDDLYRSGSTLRVATNLLYKEGEAAEVSVLTMTKTRSSR